MSAICGLFFRQSQPFNIAMLSSMMKRLAYRGIDGEAEWHHTSTGFGIQKLNITPESLNDVLPFYDLNHQLAIVADARIDNREELYQKLNISVSSQTMSDSTLILRAYQKWGATCGEHLLGDFIIVIWDNKNKQLVFITDALGVRSVYYYINDQIIAFASEIKALLALPQVPRKPNLRKIALINFLAEDSAESYFEEIFSVPAATTMIVTETKIQQHLYWQPDPHKRIFLNSEADYIEQFQTLFERAVRVRMRSVSPVASLLSGGLDSSAVSTMAARMLGQKNEMLHVFSVLKANEFAESCQDEQEYVDCFNNFPNMSHNILNRNDLGPFNDMAQIVWTVETPLYPARRFHYADCAEIMREKGLRVLMQGLHGELGPSYGGNGYYSELLLRGKIGHLVSEIRARSALTGLTSFQTLKNDALSPIFSRFRRTLRRDLRERQQSSSIRPEFIAAQLGNSIKYYHAQTERIGHVYPNHHVNQFNLLAHCFKQTKFGLKHLGAENIQSVYPYLDKDLLMFCFAIPGDMKAKNGYSRYLVRAGMRGLMPEKICLRRTIHPFAPDFRPRYNRQRQMALDFVDSLPKHDLIDSIVDRVKLKAYLSTEMTDNFTSTKNGFIGMIAAPRMVYLLHFLKTFFIDSI